MKKKNNKPLLVLIAGKSGSGKDYVTNIIIDHLKHYMLDESEYKRLRKVKSRTTRPRRYPEEDTHVFVDFTTASKEIGSALAYTHFHGNYYYATVDDTDKAMFYIIDKDGIEYFKTTEWYDRYNVLSVEITCPALLRLKRMIKRDGLFKSISRFINDIKAFRGLKTDIKMSYKQAKRYLIFEILDKLS